MSIEKYGGMADQAALKYNIPIPIFRSLIGRESSWNSSALGTSGDSGLTQLTPAIYKYLKVNPWNAQENVNGGARFLSELYGKYGNWRDALSHYNAGFNLGNGRGYADKVLAGAEGLGYTDVDINTISKEVLKSQTPILDVNTLNKNSQGGDDLKLAEPGLTGQEKPKAAKETLLQEKLSEMAAWFKKQFGIKLVLGAVIGLLLYLAITRLVK